MADINFLIFFRHYLKLFVVPSVRVEAIVKFLLLVVLVSIDNLGY